MEAIINDITYPKKIVSLQIVKFFNRKSVRVVNNI